MIKKEIEHWLNNFHVENYIINDDLTVDIEGDLILNAINLNNLPFQFGKVSGHFFCNANNLTSLQGSPYYVVGDAAVNDNKLVSLKYSPRYVGGNFYCQRNQIESLNFCPEFIGQDIICGNNNFETFEFLTRQLKGSVFHSLKENQTMKHFNHLYGTDKIITISSKEVHNILQYHQLSQTIACKTFDNNKTKI